VIARETLGLRKEKCERFEKKGGRPVISQPLLKRGKVLKRKLKARRGKPYAKNRPRVQYCPGTKETGGGSKLARGKG